MTDLDYCHLAVVERSGSMHPIREASEEALRSMLAEQIELPGRLTVTLAQFDNVYEVVLQDCPADEVQGRLADWRLEPRNMIDEWETA